MYLILILRDKSDESIFGQRNIIQQWKKLNSKIPQQDKITFWKQKKSFKTEATPNDKRLSSIIISKTAKNSKKPLFNLKIS